MTYSKRSVGESRACINHPTKSIYITESAAKSLAKLVASEMKWPVYSIRYTGRETKRVLARVRPSVRSMIVNKRGERVCTILHELAHHVACNHGNEFKRMHMILLNLWETKWKSKVTCNITKEVAVEKILNPYHKVPPKPVYTVPSKPVYTAPKGTVEQAVSELFEDFESIVIDARDVGRKLVDLGINNLENLNKVKQLLREKGKLVK
jgi:hypothetical protein